MVIIDKQEDLDDFCYKNSNSSVLSIDTEFSRHTSYYAKLSIIQVKVEERRVIIDATKGLNLNNFNLILINHNILKIFHAPREDFEIFYNLFGNLPSNVFDTQTAANICGYGTQLSYSNICYNLLNKSIDKSLQNSDWLKRPIDQIMIDYALSDVEYLEILYRNLSKIIQDNNLIDKYHEQLNSLLNINNYVINPDEAWQKIKCKSFPKKLIPTIKILARYREIQARLMNIPRKHFILDQDIIKLSKTPPSINRDFRKLNLKSKYLYQKKYQDRIIELLINKS